MLDKVVKLDGLEYDKSFRGYRLEVGYATRRIHEPLSSIYKGDENAKDLLDRIMRQVFNYIYDKLTWPEDFDKKQYLILTDKSVVRVLREVMISHLESVVLTRRDLLVMEHGVDMEGNKLIEDFDKNIEQYQFGLDTRRIFNQHRLLRYKERLNTFDLDNSLIRKGY